MKRNEFKKWASDIRLFDGSTGTALVKLKGMNGNGLPEVFADENPEKFIELQKDYVIAGTQVLLSPTLGTNPILMDTHGISGCEGLNARLTEISKKAAGNKAMVAHEIGPTGEFMIPMGMKTFDEIVDGYKEQVKGALEAEPDMFILETFIDLAEARAAVIAIREMCDLPVIASLTFQNKMTLSGNSPEAVAITMEAAGADAVGANCSTGPDEIAEVVAKMAKVTNLPLFAKPNAGMPQVVNGETTFPMGEEEFASECKKLVEAGATLIGGCCGTYPGHISLLKETLDAMKPIERTLVTDTFVSSGSVVVNLSRDRFVAIGEKINPSGKDAFAKSLKYGDIMSVVSIATEQKDAGADILDVNISAVGVDENKMMTDAAVQLPVFCPTPLCFDSSDPEVMKSALRAYCGRAIINSASAESERMEDMIKLAAQYGAVIILLPFTGNAELDTNDRIQGLEKLTDCCKEYGITKRDMLVDAVVMAVSTNQKSPSNILGFVKWCSDNDYLTTAGVSNISFGLPEREKINDIFLTQLINMGLTSGIVNMNKETKNIIDVSYLLSGDDEWCMSWIEVNG